LYSKAARSIWIEIVIWLLEKEQNGTGLSRTAAVTLTSFDLPGLLYEASDFANRGMPGPR
jgi:hypothetical protein